MLLSSQTKGCLSITLSAELIYIQDALNIGLCRANLTVVFIFDSSLHERYPFLIFIAFFFTKFWLFFLL